MFSSEVSPRLQIARAYQRERNAGMRFSGRNDIRVKRQNQKYGKVPISHFGKNEKTKKLGSVEQDSTMGPNFAICSFCPSWNLVGECLPQTLLCSAKRKRYGLRRFSFFAKTKEEPNVQNLQYPQTQSHCQDPFGR